MCFIPFAAVASNSSNMVFSKHAFRYVDLMLRIKCNLLWLVTFSGYLPYIYASLKHSLWLSSVPGDVLLRPICLADGCSRYVLFVPSDVHTHRSSTCKMSKHDNSILWFCNLHARLHTCMLHNMYCIQVWCLAKKSENHSVRVKAFGGLHVATAMWTLVTRHDIISMIDAI